MKIARLDTLQRDDNLYYDGGEPDWRYQKRQIILVEDDYDFGGNTASNITSIENWLKYSEDLLYDYQCTQKGLKSEGLKKGWNNCTNNEKDILIDYYSHVDKGDNIANTQKIVHLMTTKGYSQSQAEEYLLNKWSDHFSMFKNDCSRRWDDAVKVVISYLSLEDSAALFDIVNGLVIDYLTSARQGLGYGDSRDGLMNYVSSTFGYEGNGLRESGFTLKKGTWDTFIDELTGTLVCAYFWDDINTLYYPDATGLTAIAGTSSGNDLQWWSENLGWPYIIEVGETGYTPGVGLTYSVGAIPVMGTQSVNFGLTAGSTYDFYVTEKIGNFATIGPVTFIAS